MKKICPNCKITYEGTESWCSECGHELEPIAAPEAAHAGGVAANHAPMGASIQQDNRIHKGDEVHVSGDNLQAQSIDNSTVTNTTNITNYQTYVDETKQLVQCEISGRKILKTASYQCPVCKRTIAQEYYVVQKRMCIDCAECAAAALQAENASRERQLKQPQGQPSPQPVLQIPQPQPQPSAAQPTSAPQASGKEGGGKFKKYALEAIVTAAIIGGISYGMSSSHKESPAPQEPAMEVESVEAAPTDPAAPVASETPKAKPAAVKEIVAEPAAPAVEAAPKAEAVKKTASLYDQGRDAYGNQEFSKAAVLLEQSLSSGESRAGYYLGMLYAKGNGVTKNAKKAFMYMKQAADGGCSDAYYELGEMYRLGKGTEPNRALAQKWYGEAVAASGKNADKAASALAKYN